MPSKKDDEEDISIEVERDDASIIIEEGGTSEPSSGWESVRREFKLIKAGLGDRFRIDTRSLAVFRVFVGFLIIADILLRSRNFFFFYTDGGAVPEFSTTWIPVFSAAENPLFSVYFLADDPLFVGALFVLQVLVAVQLILGYRTRTATVLSFVLVMSLDHYNPFVLSASDALFRLLLFWAVFLPLGERWSVDAVHRDSEPRKGLSNIASAAILLQMVTMYFVNAYHKAASDMWSLTPPGSEAALVTMGLDQMTFLLGEYVHNFPTLLMYGGTVWFYMLLFSWLLVLLTGRKRTALIAAFVLGHLSFAVTVRIGAFAYVSIAGLALFLQGGFWQDSEAFLEYLGVDVYKKKQNLTQTFCRIATRFPRLRVDSEKVTVVSDGLHSVALYLVVISVTVFLVFSFTPVDDVTGVSADDRISSVAKTFGVSQSGVDEGTWEIFAPNPGTTDVYYVFPAESEDGDLVDVYSERPLSYDRPYERLQKQYGTYRERFYMGRVVDDARRGFEVGLPIPLAQYFCDRWSDEHDGLVRLNMYVVEEQVTVDTVGTPEEREKSISRIYMHGCEDNEPELIEPPEEGDIGT